MLFALSGLAFGLTTPDESVAPLLKEAERELAAMKTSTYQHQTDVNERTGKFNYDCSGFVCYMLERIQPKAVRSISHAGHKRPLAEHFYNHFEALPTSGNNDWSQVNRVQDAKPGDIIVWLKPPQNKSTNTGHMVVVRQTPIENPDQKGEYLIRIIDSTSSIHADDTRKKSVTGLGSGTIGLIVDKDGKPTAYRWRGSQSKTAVSTKILIARLR